jgi:UDP-GlcNAc3NAcA epimerase
MKLIVVIGARPQFIKHAPFEFAARDIFDLVTIHTGQHYDDNMSKVFFDQLNIKKPDYLLSNGGGNHGEQTGKMLQEIEPILLKEKPDYMVVYGDTNSTLAGALAASKLHIPVIHIEAGLRSFNKSMPEEINRILTDHMSELLFTSTNQGLENLNKEGIVENVHMVDDIMGDSVKLAEQLIDNKIKKNDSSYYYVTIHRPYNTDEKSRIGQILDILNKLNNKVVFPIHPRTRNLCRTFGIDLGDYQNIDFIEPTSYFDNINFIKNSLHAITDSGGLQKEAYILGVPCVTIRSETEWVETLNEDWNVLCFNDLDNIPGLLDRKLGKHIKDLYGTGNSAVQIIKLIKEHYANTIH